MRSCKVTVIALSRWFRAILRRKDCLRCIGVKHFLRLYLNFFAAIERTNSLTTRQQTENKAKKHTRRELISPSSMPSGFLNVHLWTDICGAGVDVLRNWLHFPFFPDKRSFTLHFHRVEDSEVKNYGERCFGFVHPERSGQYKYAITSDGTSELWLSTSEDPAAGQMIARVHSPDHDPLVWTQKGDFKKYPDQITLNAGKKYFIDSLSIQAFENAHLSVYWSRARSSNSTFEIISSKYLSSFSGYHNEDTIATHAGKQHMASIERKRTLSAFNHFPFVNKGEYINAISSCSYSPSFLVQGKLEVSAVELANSHLSLAYLQDDNEMFSFDEPNLVIDKNRVDSIVQKILTSLRSNQGQRVSHSKSPFPRAYSSYILV